MPSRWSQWKKEWKDFAAQPPGRRFRDRREHRRTGRGHRGWWRRALNLALGIVLLAIGVFLAVAPGPAVLFFALGGMLVASESKFAAGVLDRIDVLIAPALRWVAHRWKNLSRPVRRLAAVCLVGGSLAAMAVGFMLMR